MASMGRGQDGRQHYARMLGCASRSTVDAHAHRYLMWDGSVRWVREGAELPYSDVAILVGRNTRFAMQYTVGELGTCTLSAHARFLAFANAYFVFDKQASVRCDGKVVQEIVRFVDQKGDFQIETTSHNCAVRHCFYPAVQAGGLVERVTVTNISHQAHTIAVSVPHYGDVRPTKNGKICFWAEMADDTGKMLSHLDVTDMHARLESEESADFYVVYYAVPEGNELLVDCRLEYKKWQEIVQEGFQTTLRLDTPVATVNAAFAHAATYAAQNVMDTPSGMLVTEVGEGVSLETWATSIVYFALSGNYRGLAAAKNALKLFVAQYQKGKLPAAILSDGTPVGEGSKVIFALGCVLWGVLGGENDLSLYETIRTLLCEPLPSKMSLYDCSLTCFAYIQAAAWALQLQQSQDRAMWQRKTTELNEYIERRFGDAKTGAYIDKSEQSSVMLPALAGVTSRQEECARHLFETLYDKGAVVYDGKNKGDACDAKLLLAVAGLQNVGFNNMAMHVLTQYTEQCLLGEGAPYPTDRRDRGGLAATKESLLYCAVTTAGLFGLRTSGNSLIVCPHFPPKWRYATLYNVHIASHVLTLSWREGTLVVYDLYGEEVYRGNVLLGQPVMLNF